MFLSFHYLDIFLDIISFSYLYLSNIFMIFTVFAASCRDSFIAGKEIQSVATEVFCNAGCWWNIKSKSANEIIWVKVSGKYYVEVISDSRVRLLRVIRVSLPFFFFAALLVLLKTDKIAKTTKIYSKFDVLVSTFFRGSGKCTTKNSLQSNHNLKQKLDLHFFFFFETAQHPDEGSLF